MPAEQSAEFKKAAEDSKKLKEKPTDNELLQLYAHFKQGSQDPPIEDSPAPGSFDFKGKAKRNAWKKLADDGVTPEKAQENYIELVAQAKEKYGFTG